MRLTGAKAARAVAWFGAWIGLAATAQADALSRADYTAHKRQIEADFRVDRAGCERRTGHDRSVCLVQAQGRLKVALAELDYNASGKEADATRLAVAKGDSDYAVARERCDGAPDRVVRERCLTQAEASRKRALNPSRAAPLRRF